jgi:hypothetical protein
MALLRGYFDASFSRIEHGAPRPVACVGGYIGTEANWTVVERQWNDNLDLWSLKEFHLSPLLHGDTHLGRFKGKLCARSFARIIGESDLHSTSSSLDENDWKRLGQSSKFVAKYPHPYHTCFDNLLDVMATQMREEFPDDVIAVIMDKDASEHAAHSIFDSWKVKGAPFVTLTFGTKTCFPLLQCADLQVGTDRQGWLCSQSWNYPETSNIGALAQGPKGRSCFWSVETQHDIDAAIAHLRNEPSAL